MKKTAATIGAGVVSFVIAGAIAFGVAGSANAAEVDTATPIVSVSGSAGLLG